MGSIAIQTAGLTRDFGDLRAVDDLTLDVNTGTVFGFLGPNGSGKTTTIRLLLGLLAPTSGHAEVLGFDPQRDGDEIRLRTGALLEHTGLYERLSAEDNLEFFSRIWRIPEAERKRRIHGLLTHLGLWDRREERVGQWSRGMRQKLAVARTLIHRPQLIFLDEPTAGLDPVASAALRDDLAALAATEGVTVFLTTHNLAEAEKICDQIGVVRNGKLLAVGRSDELRREATGRQVEIETSGVTTEVLAEIRVLRSVATMTEADGVISLALRDEQAVAPIVGLLVSRGVGVEEVRKTRASLEDTFLSLIAEDA